MILLAFQLQTHHLAVLNILLVVLILWSNVMMFKVISREYVKHCVCVLLTQKQTCIVKLFPMCSVKVIKSYFLYKWWNFTNWDYAERLYTHFDLEIQSNYFGNGSSLSIETISVKCVGINHNSPYEFYSYLSDYSGQYLSTIHAHIISMLNELLKSNKLNRKCTIRQNTDCCCKRYYCGATLYFLSLLSSNFNINIDIMIDAPGY